MALAQKQSTMEKGRRSRNKLTHLWSTMTTIYDKGGNNIQWRKYSLFNKQYQETWAATCKKNEISTPYQTIYKNNLEMDQRPICKTGHYNTVRGKHRQNTQTLTAAISFVDPPPRVVKIKTKLNK